MPAPPPTPGQFLGRIRPVRQQKQKSGLLPAATLQPQSIQSENIVNSTQEAHFHKNLISKYRMWNRTGCFVRLLCIKIRALCFPLIESNLQGKPPNSADTEQRNAIRRPHLSDSCFPPRLPRPPCNNSTFNILHDVTAQYCSQRNVYIIMNNFIFLLASKFAKLLNKTFVQSK